MDENSAKMSTQITTTSTKPSVRSRSDFNEEKKQNKRPSQQLYVPRGRRSLNLEHKSQNASSPRDEPKLGEQTNTQEPPVLIDPSIVGYISSSPTKSPEKLSDVKKTDASIVDVILSDQVNKMSIASDEPKDEIQKIDSSVVNVIKTSPLKKEEIERKEEAKKMNVFSNENVDSWDSLYDESGESVDKKLIEQLNKAVDEEDVEFEVKQVASINYLKWIPKDVEIEESG